MLQSTVTAVAPQSSSTNYQVNEVFLGAGGSLNSCSGSYCSKQAVGETAVGNTSSNNYQAQAGFNTDRTPYLQFVVSNPNTDVGVLSTGAATTTTNSFKVKDYLSQGYQVVSLSNAPQYNSYILHNLTSPTTSSPGTEQFGINLVANTSPSVGSNPVQVPSSSTSFGLVSSGYNTPNQFKYVPGDTIAYSTKSSGETDFTISYLYNISTTTPGGYYKFNEQLVATATY